MAATFPLEIDDESGPILPPWYVRGWTAQNKLTYNTPAPPDLTSLSQFPLDQLFTVLTEFYYDADSNPLGGYLTFWPSDAFTITESGNTWRIPQRHLGTMTWPAVDVGTSPFAFSMEGSGRIFIWEGMLTALLFNPDNPHLATDSGNPLTYHVTEHFLGGRQYDITFNSSTTQGASLSSLIISGSVAPFQFDPRNPMGDFLPPPAAPVPATPPSILWISSVSTEYVRVNVTAALAETGLPANPTADAVYFAFMTPGVTPGSGDWKTAAWAGGGPPYTAEILIGPSGTDTLAQGKYAIWFKIVDSPEIPVIQVGTLYITT
jgi:hypothetical protein